MSISEKSIAPAGRPEDERPRWPILQQPRGLIVYMALLVSATLFLFGGAVALTAPAVMDLVTLVALLTGAVLCVEAGRRLGTPAGINRDFLGAWWFPAVLLLPPLYALILPVPVFLMLQYRTRRALLHRRVFNAASIALSGFLASVTWHSIWGGGLVDGLSGTPGAHEYLTTGPGVLVAVLCCTGFTVLNNLLVAVAARISSGPGHTLRPMWDREALIVDAVELCVGVTVAILAHLSLFLLVIAVPPVLLLQRSLMYQQLQMAARTDPKTGLLNAPTWEQEASVEIARARSSRGRAAVLIIDIDHFKRVNDNHGHLFGDQVLLGVATTIAQQLRQSDLLGRFGGEEFVVLLPGSDTAEAWRAAERLRSQVGRMEIAVDDVPVSITISIGAAVIGDHGNDLVELLTAADLALYRAKETGRNRVCLPAGRTGSGGKIPGPRGGEIPGQTDPKDPTEHTELP
ncbi:GGDEF domain-containing protein [Nocardiopsis dassonvillei]|uniref:GGDEF domain-containing protein n=1 Tax=Nocardiopsis dassonvillei TaxID=2014 RepID=UPI00102C5701|nr:GGDEF domain-containing protein [Nocardiopsis dassonvillei]MCP3013822.1 GGDEF domain-containing protein [Nocardiopsis dassonvillei]